MVSEIPHYARRSDKYYLYYRRKHRRIATQWLSSRAVDEYTHVLDYEATVLVQELYKYGDAGKTQINPQPHA
ncbi:hypothetical protein H0H93_005616, partial [Arthromyces matolae]